jgi:hypothetical protein
VCHGRYVVRFGSARGQASGLGERGQACFGAVALSGSSAPRPPSASILFVGVERRGCERGPKGADPWRDRGAGLDGGVVAGDIDPQVTAASEITFCDLKPLAPRRRHLFPTTNVR